MEQISIKEIQCPKCGEYRLGKPVAFNFITVLLSILTLGLYSIIYALWTVNVSDKRLKPGDKLKCYNCKTQFIYEDNQQIA